MYLLEVKDVSKKFGGVKALQKVSLNVEKQKIYGLIGPNGAGKSTLFKVIMGILKPDEGKILFKGENIAGRPAHKIYKMGLACTFQLATVFLDLSAFDNIRLGVMACGKDSDKKIDERVNELLNLVGLVEKKNVLAKNLTLPERKKLDLARALGVSPELLLVDEIVPGLTPTEVANVIELIKRIRDVYGTTVIMVEHVMRVVMSVSEWIFVLNHGEKIAEGAPREITRNELVVKAYLGDKTKNINR